MVVVEKCCARCFSDISVQTLYCSGCLMTVLFMVVVVVFEKMCILFFMLIRMVGDGDIVDEMVGDGDIGGEMVVDGHITNEIIGDFDIGD